MRDRICKHHIRNRCKGGGSTEDNLLKLWKSREILFHKLFGNRTLREAAQLLNRVARAKEAQQPSFNFLCNECLDPLRNSKHTVHIRHSGLRFHRACWYGLSKDRKQSFCAR